MKARLLLFAGAVALAAWLSGCASGPGRRIPVPGVSAADSSAAPRTANPAPQAGSGVTSKSPTAPGAPSASPAPGPGTGLPPGAAADTGKQALVPGTIPAGDIKVTTSDPAPPKGEPLIMENADRMEGFRSRGEYILAGKVRFTHGALRLETERAVWMKDRSLIYAESGMRIMHRGALLTSERGSYDKNLGQATAEGQVRMRDSSGEVEASGNSVTYLRFKHLATLTGSPEVRRYYRKTDSSLSVNSAPPTAQAAPGPNKPSEAPSAPAPAIPVSKPLGEITDTLVIRGKVLTFNDSSGVATADQDVRITRKEMEITCKKAEYHDRADSLYLTGEPQVKFDESLVKGVMMKVGMNGEEIRSLLVKGNAQAKSVEPATDTSVARQSDVLGDSLFMAFRNKAIDSVQVFRNAKGSYFDVDKPGFVNRMSGDYMVLRFVDKQVNSANVLGKAKSTYFHLEKKVFKGKNDAEGDTIDFAFKDGKVQEVLVRGQAKGTYFGEPSRKKKGGPDSNTAVPADTALGADGKPAALVPAVPAPAAAVKPAPAPKDGASKEAPAGSQPAPESGEGKRKEIDPAQQPYTPWRRK